MNITRQPEVVEAYHYDLLVGKTFEEGKKPETQIKVNVNPLDVNDIEDFPKDGGSVLGLRIEFQIVFEEFMLSGSVRQVVAIDRVVKEPSEFSQEELDELVKPLFSMIERLTYEVTEIALDQPGIQLNFQAE